jgi:hypothetical protein
LIQGLKERPVYATYNGIVQRDSLGQPVVDHMEPCPGIPRNSRIRLESLPKRRVIYDGTASKSLPIDLSPGKYAISISKFTDEGLADFSYEYEFYHECTEQQFRALVNAKPTFVKIMNTSQGPRWRCTIKPCDFESTSQYDAVIHEWEHRGVNILDKIAKESSPVVAATEAVKPVVLTEAELALIQENRTKAALSALKE